MIPSLTNFSFEWQVLQARKNELLENARTLERELENLPTEPAMKALLESRDRLKKKTDELQHQISNPEAIKPSGFLLWLCYGFWALFVKKEGNDQIAQCESEIAELKKLRNNPLSLFTTKEAHKTTKKRIATLQAEIVRLRKITQDPRDENRQEKQKEELAKVLAEISGIDELYANTKKCLEKRLALAQEEKTEQYEEILRWVAQDRQHLQWIMENESRYKDDAVRLYQEQFPEDKLSDLIENQEKYSPVTQSVRIRKREAKPQRFFSAEDANQKEWDFCVCFGLNDKGQKLTQNEEEFLRGLTTAFDKINYRDIDPRLVYENLMWVIELPVHQRQKIREVSHTELVGWKIVEIGSHRLFLSISEAERHIRFIVRPRKDAYKEK